MVLVDDAVVDKVVVAVDDAVVLAVLVHVDDSPMQRSIPGKHRSGFHSGAQKLFARFLQGPADVPKQSVHSKSSSVVGVIAAEGVVSVETLATKAAPTSTKYAAGIVNSRKAKENSSQR